MARRRQQRPEDTVAQRADDASKAARVLLSAYAATFTGMAGKLVLEDLVARFHDHETQAMNQQTGDILPGRIIAAEGQRTVIFYIRNMMEEAEKDARGESAATGRVEELDVFGDPK